MRNPDRILLVRLSHLGDVVHALGLYHALHEAYPQASFTWAIQPEFAPLVAGLPHPPALLLFDRRGGPRAWFRLRRELAALRPDWTVDAQGNTKSAAVAWLSRAARRVAPARADWQEPWAAWSANERAPALRLPARHAMDRMAALARQLIPEVALPLRLDVGLSSREEERGRAELLRRLPGTQRAPLLLHLSSPEDVRAWPAEGWRRLVTELRRRGRAVLVLSGPGEALLGRELERELGADAALQHWVGQRGLRELAALFTAAARQGSALVCCDSGPMHLAAAQGLRVIALEGPQDGARTGPWPAIGGHRVVRSSHPPPCAPCLKHTCRHADGPVCMAKIEVEDVLGALDQDEGAAARAAAPTHSP